MSDDDGLSPAEDLERRRRIEADEIAARHRPINDWIREQAQAPKPQKGVPSAAVVRAYRDGLLGRGETAHHRDVLRVMQDDNWTVSLITIRRRLAEG
jgi:hypothetical protein